MQITSEIWIAEDDRSLRWVMEKAIKREGIEVRSFENGDDLLVALNNCKHSTSTIYDICHLSIVYTYL